MYLRYQKEKLQNVLVVIIFLSSLGTIDLHGQTVQEFVQEAITNNPEIKALKLSNKADQEKIEEVTALRNTKVGAGYFVSEPETRTGAQKLRLNAQQDFDWFGTLASRKAEATAMTQVSLNRIEILSKKITLKVEQLYYKVYELKAKINIIEAQESLIDAFKETLLKAVEVNQASAVDVLKVSIAKNELLSKKEKLKGDLLIEENKLNQVLNRDGFEALEIPDNLIIPDEEPTLMIEDLTSHPELLNYEYLTDVVTKKVKSNQKESMPSFGIGLDYILVEERPDLSFDDNGKDILMPTVSLSIPLFNTSFKSRSKQLDFEKQAIEEKKNNAQNDLEILLDQALNNRITARIAYTTQVQNIKDAKKAEELVMVSYSAGSLKFSEVLELQQMILDLEYKKIEAIASYFIQSAVINYLS